MNKVLSAVVALVSLTQPVRLSATGLFQPLDPQKAITQLLHDVWQYDEGLPQNTVHALIQSSDGYLWLGTEEGLARFDGRTFTVYDGRNTLAFERGHNVLALKEGADGRIWIGTDGAGVLYYRDGVVQNYMPLTSFGSVRINDIELSSNGTLFLGTSKNGLLSCVQDVCTKFDTSKGLPGNLVQTIALSASDELWIGTDQGLAEMHVGADQAPHEIRSVSGSLVQELYIDREDRVWVGTHSGLMRIEGEHVRHLDPSNGWPEDVVWSIVEDGSGSIWLGLDHTGMARYHDGSMDTFTPEEGLSNGRVLSVMEDREGSLWIGTGGGGLNRLRDGAFTTWSEREGLVSNAVSTVFEDRAGAILVGTFGGGISKLVGSSLTSITTESGLPSNVVTSIAGAPNGAYWIGTVDAGLTLWKDRRIRSYTSTNGLASNAVYALYTSLDGRLWVGTDNGLSVIDGSSIRSYTTADGLSGNSVTAIAESPNGELWIGTYEDGLNLFNNGKFTSFTTDSGLGSNTISALYLDQDGTLWIGTYGGGLTRFKDNRFLTFGSREGLFDDKIFQILEDDNGNLWMGCNRGVFSVSKRDLDDVGRGATDRVGNAIYGTDDGLRTREVNGGVQPAGWRGSDGRLWFPTVSGVAVVNPTNLRRNETIPPVVIESVYLDDIRADLRKGVEVSPSVKRIEIAYAGLSLVDPNTVSYRYRLEGYEDVWVNADNETSATFTHLAPGTYTFELMASNNDGVWNREGASISFTVEPFFYQTIFFWIIVGLLFSGAIAFGHRVRVRSLRHRQKILETEVTARTHDFETATDELQATTEELRDSLEQKDILLREVHHRVKNNLQMISSLLRLQSRQVSDDATKRLFDECRDRIYSISTIHERVYRSDNLAELDFDGYLRGITEQLLVSYDAQNRNILIQIQCPIHYMDVDRAISCGLILTELVSNALKHAFPDNSEGGTIKIRMEREQEFYRLTVSDDGAGLSDDYATHTEASLGLNLVRGLVSRLGGRFTIAETRKSGPQGARFDIIFPVVSIHGSVSEDEVRQKMGTH